MAVRWSSDSPKSSEKALVRGVHLLRLPLPPRALCLRQALLHELELLRRENEVVILALASRIEGHLRLVREVEEVDEGLDVAAR